MSRIRVRMCGRGRAMVHSRRLASLLLALAAVPAGAPFLASGLVAQDNLTTSPVRVLDLSALGDRVEAGDLFARAGNAWLFWLDDLDESGTPNHIDDDKVRLALWRTDGTPKGTYPLIPPNLSFYYYAGNLGDVAFVVLCKADEPIELFYSAAYLRCAARSRALAHGREPRRDLPPCAQGPPGPGPFLLANSDRRPGAGAGTLLLLDT